MNNAKYETTVLKYDGQSKISWNSLAGGESEIK